MQLTPPNLQHLHSH